MSSSPSSETIEEGKKHAEQPIPDGTNTTIITDNSDNLVNNNNNHNTDTVNKNDNENPVVTTTIPSSTISPNGTNSITNNTNNDEKKDSDLES